MQESSNRAGAIAVKKSLLSATEVERHLGFNQLD